MLNYEMAENYLAFLWAVSPEIVFKRYNQGVPLMKQAKEELKGEVKDLLVEAVPLKKSTWSDSMTVDRIKSQVKKAMKHGIDHGLSVNEVMSVLMEGGWEGVALSKLTRYMEQAEDWYLSPDRVLTRLGLLPKTECLEESLYEVNSIA